MYLVSPEKDGTQICHYDLYGYLTLLSLSKNESECVDFVGI